MTDPSLPMTPPARLSHQVTRRELRGLLSSSTLVTAHERQRALVRASLLTRPLPDDPARERRGWIRG
jgi:hypothetical protein